MDFSPYVTWIIAGNIFTVAIAILLLHASIEDIRHRDIGSMHVVLLYIIVSLYSVFITKLNLETTYVFLFAFVLFMLISFFSKGHFGIGDSLVIGALAWYLGTFNNLQIFMYAMGAIAIPWAVFWLYRYRENNTLNGMLQGFKKTVPIGEVKVGDVLHTDHFMHGLTAEQIDRMRQDGFLTVTIKKPMPFIPVIFLAFLTTLVYTL